MYNSIQEMINSIQDKEVYKKLQKEWDDVWKRIDWLNALEEAGVDNWEGIDVAYEIDTVNRKNKNNDE